jgi:pSer/pThr/pTyr-binding forkhead associated (FHA) protein
VKFEIRYPTGAQHQVELQGTLAVLGRDPSCDLVLNDIKCSRRHAVIEAGPQGLAIRDAGSANGVYLNGRKIERSALEAGDLIRLGEVVIKVLPEDVTGTVVMAADEMQELEGTSSGSGPTPARPAPSPPEPAPAARPAPGPRPVPPPAARPAPARSADALDSVPLRTPSAAATPARAARPTPRPLQAPEPRGEVARPLTVTLLALLWAMSVFVYAGGGLMLAFAAGLARGPAIAAAVCGVFLAIVAGVMAFGIWSRSPWARVLQLVIAGMGVLVCPFSLASITLLFYLLRPEGRIHFSGRREYRLLSAEERETLASDSSEPAFAGTLFGTVVLGVVATVLGGYFLAPRLDAGTPIAPEAAIVADLRAVGAAQRNFRDGTASACGRGYADLDGLLHPASVIPNYRADGPAFVDADFARAERHGYRFTLDVRDPILPSEGCPSRAFREFGYRAQPLDGRGRHFLTGNDGLVRVADTRPARPDDPPVE